MFAPVISGSFSCASAESIASIRIASCDSVLASTANVGPNFFSPHRKMAGEVASEWEDTDASSEDGGSDDNEAIGGGFDEASRRILFPPCYRFLSFFSSFLPSLYPSRSSPPL